MPSVVTRFARRAPALHGSRERKFTSFAHVGSQCRGDPAWSEVWWLWTEAGGTKTATPAAVTTGGSAARRYERQSGSRLLFLLLTFRIESLLDDSRV